MNFNDMIWLYLAAGIIVLIILYFVIRLVFSVDKKLENQAKIIQLLKEIRDK